MIDYEKEYFKDSEYKNSKYEYTLQCKIYFDTLEDTQKEFAKFESEKGNDRYTGVNKYYMTIATLYEITLDKNDEIIDTETIDTK